MSRFSGVAGSDAPCVVGFGKADSATLVSGLSCELMLVVFFDPLSARSVDTFDREVFSPWNDVVVVVGVGVLASIVVVLVVVSGVVV